MREKKERRPAVMAPVEPVEGREVLKWGPAVPQRTRRTRTWGIQAYLACC